MRGIFTDKTTPLYVDSDPLIFCGKKRDEAPEEEKNSDPLIFCGKKRNEAPEEEKKEQIYAGANFEGEPVVTHIVRPYGYVHEPEKYA